MDATSLLRRELCPELRRPGPRSALSVLFDKVHDKVHDKGIVGFDDPSRSDRIPRANRPSHVEVHGKLPCPLDLHTAHGPAGSSRLPPPARSGQPSTG